MKFINNIIYLILGGTVFLCGCSEHPATRPDPNDHVFGFYYDWYGTEPIDGRNYHWAHKVLDDSGAFIPGIDHNIASNFYPKGGIYSSRERGTIRRHMRQMAEARIGVVCVTWWKESDIGNEALPAILDEALATGLKVCFHIEPYAGRTAESVRDDIAQLNKQYGEHPALYRIGGKPVYFCYDSYLISVEEWEHILRPDGAGTLRGTPDDAVVIALLVKDEERDAIRTAGFDGFYTYFAATGFSEGSTPELWPSMAEWAQQNDLIFIPCVGPGYEDTRIRPWNGSCSRDREQGAYYQRMFDAAIASRASYIGITSFNEWHEGTQLEPAEPHSIQTFTYDDYAPLSPDYYLKATADYITHFEQARNK